MKMPKVLLVSICMILLFPMQSFARDCTVKEYYERRPDVKAAGIGALDHYNRHGRNEGMCRPVLAADNGTCTEAEYYRRRPDVKAAGISALTHYNRHGKNEGMCRPTDSAPTPTRPPVSTEKCTPSEYYRRRPDVKAAGVDALSHYNRHGKNEGMCNPVLRETTPPPSSGSNATSTEMANRIPRGRWAYIDDMVQSLTYQYPTFWRIECRISGDTNASQDWVATLLMAANNNSFPAFMGASTSGCKDAPRPPDSKPGRNLGKQLSMGVPVYAGSPTRGDHRQSELSRKIIAEASKGAFSLVVGGPFTDVWAALKAKPSIAKNLTVYGIQQSNGPADQVAFDQVKNKLGSRLRLLGNDDYKKLIVTPYNHDNKVNWINRLRFIPEWDKANSKDVLEQNIWLNRHTSKEAKGFRLADVELTMWYFCKSLSCALDINRVLPSIERGADILRK